jgi:hypothetical protein
VPNPDELVYTQVLTKQSALFNSWKEMNRISNDQGVPFRCVTQWATHQTGKLKDTLGLPLTTVPIATGVPVATATIPLSTPVALPSTPSEPAPSSKLNVVVQPVPRKKSTSKSKLNAMPLIA